MSPLGAMVNASRPEHNFESRSLAGEGATSKHFAQGVFVVGPHLCFKASLCKNALQDIEGDLFRKSRETHREIIGNIIENIAMCLGHVYCKNLEKIW